MKEIPMPNKPGTVALVDDEDYERLSQYRWRAKGDRDTFYAYTDIYVGGKRKMTSMHSMVIKLGGKPQVDHIDHNGLNNQKSNLRAATHSENQRNRSKEKGNTSGFKGVSFQKSTGQWQASIRIDGTLVYMGCYGTKEEAARAYDLAAKAKHGKFAKLNFPEEK
jgi:hypothetical protein